MASPPPPESPHPPPSPPQAIPLALALPVPVPPPKSPQTQEQISQQTPSTPPPPESSSSQPPPQLSAPSSRRLPPPCWSPDETVALIDAYRDKWYSLRRGNLKATHWQEVADSVAAQCPAASPAKTAVQCRHKMEKLRKRYRTELQRARSVPVARFNSSWVHFKRMDSMEKGPAPAVAVPVSSVKPDHSEDDEEDDDEDADERLYEELKYGSSSKAAIGNPYRNGTTSAGGGFRIRIPTGVSVAQPGMMKYARDPPPPPMKYAVPLNTAAGMKAMRECSSGKMERDAVAEMVGAIKALGDGFVRVEQMKMEMAKEIESMRMEMEMKRTEMILDSQRRIVDAFAKAAVESASAGKRNKKLKRTPNPDEP